MQKIYALFVIFALVLSFGYFQVAGAKNDEIKLKVFEHFPKNPGKPVLASNCSATSNDQVDNYGLAGWKMPSEGMSYKINYSTKPKNLTDSQISTAIHDSFAAWNNVDSGQIFNYNGTTTAKNYKLDGVNAILFKSTRSSAIATTYVWYNSSTGQLVETDTVFNKLYKWSINNPSTGDCAGLAGTYDVQNIGTHEFGHWVGLDDLYDIVSKDLTMYGYGELGELKKNSLGSGDITGTLVIEP